MDILYLIFTLLQIVVILSVMITTMACMVWLERRVRDRMASHLGPSIMPPNGVELSLTDVIQQLRKEGFRLGVGFRLIQLAAPCIAVITVLMIFSVIPFGPEYKVRGINLFQIADLDIGVLFVLALSSIGIHGIVLAAGDSHEDSSLPDGLRDSSHLQNYAQVISCGLSMTLSIVGVVLLTGSLNLRIIVESQAGTFWGIVPDWNIIPQMIGFFCFFVGAIVVSNNHPLDRSQASIEPVFGYQADYSGKRFTMYFLAEYAAILGVACIGTVLYFGGWHGPVFGPEFLQIVLPLFWFALKVAVFLFVYVWIRGTLPQFRFDQWMAFAWKFLLPLAAINLVLTSFVLALQYG
jgi:NADH-quinone oxidoreductase subunit H